MKQFKTESKRILDLMVNSIYTNKEIFLRELISNASDAIDKLHFKSLTDHSVNTDFKIEIIRDEAARTLTITDNGVGMTRDELEKNLGTIAESGTLAYKLKAEERTELIGQFGVGFYSAFMVADRIEVTSRAYGSDEAWMWSSAGAEGYDITPAQKESTGTEVKLYLKNKDEDYDYDELLREHHIRMLVKKYSDYVRYPIVMDVTKSRKKETPGADGKDEYESYVESETLNGMQPLWKQKKSEITAEQYSEFYKAKFRDYCEPRKVFHFNLEGSVNYTALLFIPEHKPFDYFRKEYKKGLQLYSNGVLIMDKCEELLPDYLGFIKGVVDSPDLSLNVSREMLQHDRQLKTIANGIEKKILSELKKFLETEREAYEKFFEEFGLSLKFGAYNDYGLKKEEVKDLLLFHSSTQENLTLLSEYVGRMKEDQKYIYYACGDSVEKISRLPQIEQLRERGYEILFMPDNVDEFVLKTLMTYGEKEFRSAGSKDLGLESDAEKDELKSRSEENKEMFDFITETLGGAVKEVRLSTRLKNNAMCITADGEISLEMEKVFKNMGKDASPVPVRAEKVLELNPDHKLFGTISALWKDEKKDELARYARIMYAAALITEGIEPDDPASLSSDIVEILSK